MIITTARFLQKFVFLLFFSLLLQNHSFAQFTPGGPFDSGGPYDNKDAEADNTQAAGDPGDPGQDPDLPLDTNVFFLVALGVGYGLKKAWDVKQKRKKELAIVKTI